MAARGVKVRPKYDALAGNIVIFTDSSDEQSSLPYKDKQHGMFTYQLLKKIKETKGELTYFELSEHLKENVAINSLMFNSKEQIPQTIVGLSLEGYWEKWRIK